MSGRWSEPEGRGGRRPRANVVVREAEAVDSAMLLDLMREFNAAEGIPFERERFAGGLAQLFQDSSLGFLVLAEDTTGPLGYALLTYGFDLEFGGRDAFLTEIFVRPHARRQGVGEKLLAEVERLARARRVGAIHLLAYPHNEPAISLYRRAGFVASPRTFFTKRL